jgi:hypothetical protein
MLQGVHRAQGLAAGAGPSERCHQRHPPCAPVAVVGRCIDCSALPSSRSVALPDRNACKLQVGNVRRAPMRRYSDPATPPRRMTDPRCQRRGGQLIGYRGIRSDRDRPAHRRSWHRRWPPRYLRSRLEPKARIAQRGWSSWGTLHLHERCAQHHCRSSSLRQMVGRFASARSDLKHRCTQTGETRSKKIRQRPIAARSRCERVGSPHIHRCVPQGFYLCRARDGHSRFWALA